VRIKLPLGYPPEDDFEFEEAKSRLNFETGIVLLDGKRVVSYEELARLVAAKKYEDREYIEVVVIVAIAGG
jgi:hypothetical protein